MVYSMPICDRVVCRGKSLSLEKDELQVCQMQLFLRAMGSIKTLYGFSKILISAAEASTGQKRLSGRSIDVIFSKIVATESSANFYLHFPTETLLEIMFRTEKRNESLFAALPRRKRASEEAEKNLKV